MYRYICITFELLLIISFISCSGHNSINIELRRAEELMSMNPDSALHILKRVSFHDCTTLKDSARYALLLTQAHDRNYIKHINDSLIRIAVLYYDVSGNNEQKALVHFYQASIYRDTRERIKSIKSYLQSLLYAQQAKDLRLQGLIYNNIGFLYYEQDMYNKSDSVYPILS